MAASLLRLFFMPYAPSAYITRAGTGGSRHRWTLTCLPAAVAVPYLPGDAWFVAVPAANVQVHRNASAPRRTFRWHGRLGAGRITVAATAGAWDLRYCGL